MKRLRSISSVVREGQWQSALVALLCACLFLCAAALFSLQQMASSANELVARSLAFVGEPALRFKDRDAMRETAMLVAQREQLAFVDVFDQNGSLWLHYERAPVSAMDDWARAVDHWFMREPARAAIESNGFVLGQLALRADGHLLLRYLLLCLLALLLCGMATAIAVRAVSHRLAASIVAPVNALANLTREVRGSRNFERRAPSFALREINDLADDFNMLLSELEKQSRRVAARHTDLRRANASLQHANRHDVLTRLPNRAYLVEHLAQVVRNCDLNAQRAGALFVDVDHFKEVNDTHGHEAGDALLCELAQRLQAAVRDTDFVARLGGDEFIVVIHPLVDPVEIDGCVQRIHDALKSPLRLKDGASLVISVSIGAALCPDHARTIDSLIKAADTAMYKAKTTERGSFARFR